LNEKELKKILEKHKKWLNDEEGGERANLWDADLSNADLSNADLSNADLSNANLWDADLSNADLWDADLSNADLRNANLRNADLSNAKNYLPDLYILKQQSPNAKLKAWKFLNDGKSPYQEFPYKIKKTYTEKDCSTDERITCDEGLNVATLQWCLNDAGGKSEFMEVEFQAKDIVAIPIATDGKFRVKKFKTLRKISRKQAEKELYNLVSFGDEK